MSLPDLLTEAARLMPERFIWAGTRSAQVNYRGETRMFAHTGTHAELVWLEAACQEELEARGWDWMVRACREIDKPDEPPYRAVVWVYGGGQASAQASTPAEALLSALLQAVEGAA